MWLFLFFSYNRDNYQRSQLQGFWIQVSELRVRQFLNKMFEIKDLLAILDELCLQTMEIPQ